MQKELRVAILTRGYKAKSVVCASEPALSLPKGRPKDTPRGVTASGDEPAELASGCPGAAVIVNPDRVAGATEAVSGRNAQVLVMDDGFQHRHLARDLDIVTIDATLPFGYGRLLPAGLLREPIRALRRAHAVVITRCDLVSSVRVLHIETRCRHVNRDLIAAQAVHAPIGLTTLDGDEVSLEAIQGRKVFAFCGLGNPEAFFITLQRQGCRVVGRRIFDDHHHYTARCLTDLCREAGKHNAELIVTTQKDGTKIACLPRPGTPALVVCLAVELRFTQGQEELTALIDSLLDSTMPSR